MTLYNFSMIWLQLFYSNAQLLHVISFAMSFPTYTYRTLRIPLQAFYVLYSSIIFFFCKTASEVAFASTIYVFIFHVLGKCFDFSRFSRNAANAMQSQPRECEPSAEETSSNIQTFNIVYRSPSCALVHYESISFALSAINHILN